VTFAGAFLSADLGGSSDYSSGKLEGLSGEGFREQVSLPRLSRRLRAQENPLVGKLRGCHLPKRVGAIRVIALKRKRLPFLCQSVSKCST